MPAPVQEKILLVQYWRVYLTFESDNIGELPILCCYQDSGCQSLSRPCFPSCIQHCGMAVLVVVPFAPDATAQDALSLRDSTDGPGFFAFKELPTTAEPKQLAITQFFKKQKQ